MTVATSLRERFSTVGCVVHPEPILDQDLLGCLPEHMDAVIAGHYETGVAPGERFWSPGDDPTRLVKIDMPQLSDDTLYELCTSPALGAFAAELVGAEMIQVWALQLLYKPPGGDALGNVGWHQDDNYWKDLWEGEVFTLWVAVSGVSEAMGPLLYVPRSHEWGYRDGDFFSSDLEATKAAVVPDGEQWVELPALLEAGGVSAHHRRTVHGSAANRSDRPRRGFAVHVRSERSRPLVDDDHVLTRILRDERLCPVIHGG